MEGIYNPIAEDLYARHASNVHLHPVYHAHNVYEIFLLINGNINIYVETRCFHLEGGSLLLIKPGEYHRLELIDTSVYERYTINISHQYLDAYSTPQTDLSKCFHDQPKGERNVLKLSPAAFSEMAPLFEKLVAISERTEFGYDCLTLSYLLRILVRINVLHQDSGSMDIPDIMPAIVSDTMKYIDQHLTGDITLAALSGHLYHSGVYLSRRFKKVTGLSIQEYILRKRIHLAQKYLSEGRTVTESCMLSGFHNYSNFSRTFSKVVGISPKKYQEGQREGRIGLL